MSIAAPMAVQRFDDRLRRALWLRPEWWTLLLCAASWLGMSAHMLRNGAVCVNCGMTFAQELGHWMLMVGAMMLPLQSEGVRTMAFGSLWARRHRAIIGFLVGYLTLWLAAGIPAASLRALTWTHTYGAQALIFCMAAAWQITKVHGILLHACHRMVPQSLVGWRADRDCLRYGWRVGAVCVLACWPLMLGCTFTGHSPIAMVGGLGLGIAERCSFRPRTKLVAAGTLLLAGYFAALGLTS